MRKTLCRAVVFSAASLAGCAGVAPQQAATPAPTLPQVAAQVCPPVQASLAALQALPTLPAATQADLALAVPLVDAVCGVGATVDVSSLQALERTALPILSSVAEAAALSPAEQDRILAAQVVLSTVAAIADPATAQPAVPSPPATAP